MLSSSSSSSSSSAAEHSSNHPPFNGTWELTPTGLAWSIDINGCPNIFAPPCTAIALDRTPD